MPRPFQIIAKLPAKKLAELVRFCREQHRTIDQIWEWTDSAGIVVSRGAVYAWRNRFIMDAPNPNHPHTFTCPHCKRALKVGKQAG